MSVIEAPTTVTATESLSSVELSQNAKGETQAKVKVYAQGNDPEQVAAAAALALETFNELKAATREAS